MSESLETWKLRVSSNVRVRVLSDVGHIAEMCLSNPGTSVWHECSIFYGTKCHCLKCEGRSTKS